MYKEKVEERLRTSITMVSQTQEVHPDVWVCRTHAFNIEAAGDWFTKAAPLSLISPLPHPLRVTPPYTHWFLVVTRAHQVPSCLQVFIPASNAFVFSA